MKIQTIAASILALGLLAPIGAQAAERSPYVCSSDNSERGDYIECNENLNGNSNSTTFGAVINNEGPRGPVGDYIGETPQESNQRSSNR